jgi:hypothetical protein
MNIKASIIGLIATTLLSSAMIANAAPVKMAAKPAVHVSKPMVKHPIAKRTVKHVIKRSHAKPGTRVTTAKMTHRVVKVRHMKKVRHAAKTR